MLSKMIAIMQQTDEPVTLRNISYRLGLDESAVEGMLRLLIQKGVVQDQMAQAAGHDCANAHCRGCQVKGCPLTGLLPRTFRWVGKKTALDKIKYTS